MTDWIDVPYTPVSGARVTLVSPAGMVRHIDSLKPNHSTQLLTLETGRWIIRNDSAWPLRIAAHSDSGYCLINTLYTLEEDRFNWLHHGYRLAVTLCPSAQVFHRRSMDNGAYVDAAKALALSKWEYLLYKYMVAARIKCSRVPEGSSKTPDFTVVLDDTTVPLELKEFSPNLAERRDRELIRKRGYGEVQTTEIGHRVAKAAQSARSQLRSFFSENGAGPAVLAIMDPAALRHADPNHLARLFEGTLTVRVAVSDGSIVDIHRKEDRRRSPRKRNGILSAIAVLSIGQKVGRSLRRKTEADGHIVADLAIYHNPYAEYSLPTRAFAPFGFPQHIIAAIEPPAVDL